MTSAAATGDSSSRRRSAARAVGLEIDAERAEAARANGCVDVRTCNALDEAEWSKAFDDGVTCAFLYLVPRGLRLVAPRLIERSKTRPIRVVTYMAPLPGATYVEKTTVTPAHQPSAAWPLYAYDLGVATVKVCVVGRDAAKVVGCIAQYHLLEEGDEAPQPVDEAVVRFPRTRYGVMNVSLHTSGEGPFDGYIVLASERWKDYVTAAHTVMRRYACWPTPAPSTRTTRAAPSSRFRIRPRRRRRAAEKGCSERDKDGLPRIVRGAAREADWASTTPVEAEEPAGPHVAVMGPDARPLYRALCLKLGAAPVDDVTHLHALYKILRDAADALLISRAGDRSLGLLRPAFLRGRCALCQRLTNKAPRRPGLRHGRARVVRRAASNWFPRRRRPRPRGAAAPSRRRSGRRWRRRPGYRYRRRRGCPASCPTTS